MIVVLKPALNLPVHLWVSYTLKKKKRKLNTVSEQCSNCGSVSRNLSCCDKDFEKPLFYDLLPTHTMGYNSCLTFWETFFHAVLLRDIREDFYTQCEPKRKPTSFSTEMERSGKTSGSV